jgi:hypothetical protein
MSGKFTRRGLEASIWRHSINGLKCDANGVQRVIYNGKPDSIRSRRHHSPSRYITALPQAEHDVADWQVAMETRLLVAERDGP